MRIRFQHAELKGDGFGAEGVVGGVARIFCGNAQCHDEGDLLVAARIPSFAAAEMLRSRELRNELVGSAAPELAVEKWLNAPGGVGQKELRGKAVLIDFWATSCGPCVAKLPDLQALHEKYKDRGLIVLGVHSAEHDETLEKVV